ncbi:unnamed protein product [Blepharisma stoltei]|uniref:Leucine Rich Repeat family protein n=1 Tax=Blepharisma stoltei TaxID=1481888 RepID=A0AAU9IN70_9CILI|nr:unnamed protein product [Blepharisma stoltei]
MDYSFRSKESIEASWMKLENSFSTSQSANQSISVSARPNTSDFIQKPKSRCSREKFHHNRSASLQNQSMNTKHSRASSQDYPISHSHSISYSTFIPKTEQYSINGLDAYQIHRIYVAKCNDLKIPVLLDQEKNFFSYCHIHFTKRKFELSESGIGPKAAKAIGEVIEHNKEFAYLELSKNIMGDKGAIILAKALCRNTDLVHLDVSSNDITPEGASALIMLVLKHPSIASLNISSHEGLHRNRLGIVGASAIRRVLESSMIISFLNIAGTSIGPEGLISLSKGLKNSKTLVSLNIANNGIGSTGISNLAEAIASSSLKILNISLNKIGNEGCDIISNLLMGEFDAICPLETLDLSQNEISTRGAFNLFTAATGNIILQTLNLEKNKFSSGLSPAFHPFVCGNTKIKMLNLAFCQIKSEGICTVGDGLIKNKTLRILNISNNVIDDNGAEAISIGLHTNRGLKFLDLSNNFIKNKGGLALAQALKMNQCLEQINLKGNGLKDDAAQQLSEISRFRPNLVRLVLDLNPVSFKYLNDIKGHMKHNVSVHQKYLVPKLRSKISDIQFNESEFDTIRRKIESKMKEKTENQQKLEKQNVRYIEVKENEEKKYLVIHEEFEKLYEQRKELSKAIDELEGEIKKTKIIREREIKELSDKIAYTVSEAKQLEKQKTHKREQLGLLRNQHTNIINDLRAKLENEELLKRNAESTIYFAKKKLDEKSKELARIKNTENDKNIEAAKEEYETKIQNAIFDPKVPPTKLKPVKA